MHRRGCKRLIYVHVRNGLPFTPVFYRCKRMFEKSQKTSKNGGLIFEQQSNGFGHFSAGCDFPNQKWLFYLSETAIFNKNINFTSVKPPFGHPEPSISALGEPWGSLLAPGCPHGPSGGALGQKIMVLRK